MTAEKQEIVNRIVNNKLDNDQSADQYCKLYVMFKDNRL